MSRENIEELEKEINKLIENKKIKIRGPIEIGEQNFIKFSKNSINSGGIKMVMDLLAEITGVTYDAPLNWRFPGEKGKLSSLHDYLSQILKKWDLKEKN